MKTAKLILMTFAYRSTSFLVYGATSHLKAATYSECPRKNGEQIVKMFHNYQAELGSKNGISHPRKSDRVG